MFSRSCPQAAHVTSSTPAAAFGLIARYAARSRSTSTWCNSAVNRASLSRTATCRTRSSALVASGPALCPGRVLLAVFPLVDPLSSTGSAVAIATLFVGFAGTTGPSDFPHPFIPGLPPRRSLSVPPADQRCGQARDLPVLAHGRSVHALVP